MKPSTKFAVIFAFSWAILKLILFNTSLRETSFEIGIMANMLFMILAIFLTLYSTNDSGSFLSDFKVGMQATAKYAIIIGLVIFVYYKFIDVDFFEKRIIERQNIELKKIKEIDGFENFVSKNPDYKGMSQNDYLERLEEQDRALQSPGTQFTLSVFGMIFLGLIYSLIITLLNRKVLRKLQ